ncbi:serine hydrolase domain-containing protein [Streptomyces sp. NPDC029041]|uniref:serine hydrolase domain-containing protein n=1 Tax=Streptomyces sp. NPDC029041 TaxID=3155727 RepID=UPI0033DEE27C
MSASVGARIANGEVAAGFEAVADALASADLGGGGGAFAAFVEGRKVADLWIGDAAPGQPWAEDTMTTLFSSGKAVAALCAQVLYDRGDLDVDAPVVTYWPEYGAAGKEKTLVRHILAHTAGLPGLRQPETLLDWEGRGWGNYAGITERLAGSPPRWEPGTRVGYHGMTYGWLVAELVRRVSGKSLGTFLREEIGEPFGLDLWIGTPEAELPRVATLTPLAPPPPGPANPLHEAMHDLSHTPGTMHSEIYLLSDGRALPEMIGGFFATPAGRIPEVASAGVSASARSLAEMYAYLSLDGSLDGKRLVSPQAVERFAAEEFVGPSAIVPEPEVLAKHPEYSSLEPIWERWGLGYRLNVIDRPYPQTFGPEESAFGMPGAGAQLGFADRVNRVSVGFVRNHMSPTWHASTQVVDALYKCLGVSPEASTNA